MGAVRIIILGVAAVFAVGLALIVRNLAGHRAAPPAPTPVVVQQAPAQPMAQVLVARRDLPQGTRLTQGDLGWQAWPVASLNPAFITDGRAPEAAPNTPVAVAEKTATHAVVAAAATVAGGPMEARYGNIVREPILANEPITDVKLVHGGDGGILAVQLHPGMRAVGVPISVASAAGGFILPGDRVDVLQSHAADSTGGAHGFVTEVLLRNVRVLAIDQGAQPPKGAATVVGAVATLEVTSSDAEVLARGKAQGEMVLALRAYADAGAPSGHLGGGGGAGDVVRILRNGQASEVTVAQ